MSSMSSITIYTNDDGTISFTLDIDSDDKRVARILGEHFWSIREEIVAPVPGKGPQVQSWNAADSCPKTTDGKHSYANMVAASMWEESREGDLWRECRACGCEEPGSRKAMSPEHQSNTTNPPTRRCKDCKMVKTMNHYPEYSAVCRECLADRGL